MSMADAEVFISLFYDVTNNNFKIKTNLKENKINEVLAECYRTTLYRESDEREPIMRNIYNISISLDLSNDSFKISSDTGNNILSYELIRESIDKWELLPEEVSADKNNLGKILLNN